MKTKIDRLRFRGELAQRALAQWRFAREVLGVPPSTFSEWMSGARPAPGDLRQRIEEGLKLSPGSLSPKSH